MYRVVLITLFILAESKWQKPINTGYQKPKKPEKPQAVIAKVVEKLMAADRILEDNCARGLDVREISDDQGYLLKYKLQYDIEDFVRIKIKNSVMHVNVQLEEGTVNDFKILPSGVETRDAIWWIEGNDLVITMPYKVKRGVDMPLDCGHVEDKIVDVPLSPEYDVYEYLNKHIGIATVI